MTRTVPSHVDSTGKILHRLSLLSPEPVYQHGKMLNTPPLRITLAQSLLRKFSCTVGCNACCLPFTLDFLPEEFEYNALWSEEVGTEAYARFEVRPIEVNGDVFNTYSYPQYLDDQCPFLKPIDALGGAKGCSFFPFQPLECAAAPNLLMTTRGEGNTSLQKRPFGRGWAWKDTPQCGFAPTEQRYQPPYHVDDVISLMQRYEKWAAYLNLHPCAAVIRQLVDVLQQEQDKLAAHSITFRVN